MQRLNRLSERADDGAAQGWYVDVPHNQVVVEATKGASDEVTWDFLAALPETFAYPSQSGRRASCAPAGSLPCTGLNSRIPEQ